jgi:hypothetical protein
MGFSISYGLILGKRGCPADELPLRVELDEANILIRSK